MASSGPEAREARSAKRAARETKTEDTDERTALLYNALDMLESQGFLREQIATAAMDVERETQPYGRPRRGGGDRAGELHHGH